MKYYYFAPIGGKWQMQELKTQPRLIPACACAHCAVCSQSAEDNTPFLFSFTIYAISHSSEPQGVSMA